MLSLLILPTMVSFLFAIGASIGIAHEKRRTATAQTLRGGK